MSIDKDEGLSAATKLRGQAEEQLRTKTAALPPLRTKKEQQRLVHELEVHQIELEMQNAELLQARDELEVSRNTYAELYDFAPVGYFTFDTHGLIRKTNLAGAKLLGRERGLLANRPFSSFIADADGREIFSNHLKSVLQKKGMQRCDLKLTREDGTVIYGQLQSVALETLETKDGYILISIVDDTTRKQLGDALQKAHDNLEVIVEERTRELAKVNQELLEEIDERKRAEEVLHKSEGRLRTLVQTIPDLIWLKDQDGVYLACNPMFERFFGAGELDIIGKTDYDFVDRELADFFVEHDRQAMAAGKPTRNEEWITFSDDGHRALLETTKTPMYDAGGALIGVLGIGHDITEHRRLEDQFVQAQKMESVGRLAGGVAHDYNNMLSVILGHAELALAKTNPAEPLHEDLQEIIEAAKRSTEITRQLLAFARKQTIAPKVIDLNETVEGMLKMLRRLIGEEINLAWLPGLGLMPMKIDPSQLDQILANLCVNARDAITDVGKVTIQTDMVTLDKADCNSYPSLVPGNYVLLTVTDDGCGMDKEIQAKVFEPFFTTKGLGQGTGLGLATVYGIVKQNKGFVNVYSEPGLGTTFKIYLPCHVSNAVDSREEHTRETPLGQGEVILVVEDEVALLKLSRTMLESLGYAVLTASKTGEAMQLAKAHAGRIDLVIIDVVMPEMNGRELADQLQTLYPKIKILFMSGYTADIIAHHGVLAEGMHFIQKPLLRQDLAAKVHEVLAQAERLWTR
ncbi:MAG: PAS domain S-box protein [Proteobacteria bacterium]|nr:PAS domain S-box protein [Pseudomonadota bacterium]MBU4294612.1 PAS domain S-box protein [Pseudomonadota bacterium]MCG2745988.1 PAS domain S-box protein [Desulfobulbaceae bacterium]